MTIHLSPRQKQILEAYANGKRGREIASDLRLRGGTLRNYLVGIKGQLGATTIAHAVALGVVYGLVKVETHDVDG